MTRFRTAAVLMALGLAIPFAGSAEDAPGWFKVPGIDTQIKFNGFAETAFAYELLGQQDFANNGEIYNNAPAILLDKDPRKFQAPNYAGAESFYSRFGFNTKTPSGVGEIGVRIEGDFNHNLQLTGASFTHKGDLRVRHAYGTVGGWLLIGQSWSTFADLATFIDQQDENPPQNQAAIRAPQIRVTAPLGPVKVSVAAEDPYATNLGLGASPFAGGLTTGKTKWEYPDFIARIDIPTPMASLSLRGVTKQFKTAEASATGAQRSVSAQAFGGAVGAAVKVGGDTLVLDGSAGTGLGAYQYGTVLGPVPEDAIATPTDVKLFTSFGASAGYTHVWSPQFRSNIAGSAIWVKDDVDVRTAAAAATVNYGAANQRVLSGLANTYWTFARNAWVGAEFWYNYRKTFGGDIGHESRLLATAHFDFM